MIKIFANCTRTALLQSAVLCISICPGPAMAQTAAATSDASAPMRYACKGTRVNKPDPDDWADFTTTETYTWDGACVGGFADGPGKLSSDDTTEGTGNSRQTTRTITIEEGTFRSGLKTGIWCPKTKRQFIKSDPQAPETTIDKVEPCSLAYDMPYPSLALGWWPRPDGNWEIRKYGSNDLTTPLVIDRETMDKTIVQQTPPTAKTIPNFKFSTAMLEGLIPGGTVTGVGDLTGAVDINGKRVAVVLSSKTVTELSRWTKQREAFIKSRGYGKKFPKLGDGGYEDTAYSNTLEGIAAITNPSRLTLSLIAALKPVVGERGQVIAANDLTVLASGQADYALVVDWRFEGGILSPAEIAKMTPCKSSDDKLSGKCAYTLKNYWTVMLLDNNINMLAIEAYNFGDHTREIPDQPYNEYISSSIAGLWDPDGDTSITNMTAALAARMPWEKQEALIGRYRSGDGLPKGKGHAELIVTAGTMRNVAGSFRLEANHHKEEIEFWKSSQAENRSDMIKFSSRLATYYYKKAADLGDSEAASELVFIYQKGNAATPVNLKLAGKYAQMAYDRQAGTDRRHSAVYAWNLGLAKEFGWAEPADLEGALKLFEIAKANGDTDAPVRIAAIRNKLAAQAEAAARAKAAAAADAAFASSLKAAPSAAALYALADEMAEKGEHAKARTAFRELLRRYPNSALAAKAADRMAVEAGSPTPTAVNSGRASGGAATNMAAEARNSPASSASGSAPYQTQIPNPVMPAAFYRLFSGRNLSATQCEAVKNDRRASAIMDDLQARQDGSGFQATRAAIISSEVTLVTYRQCENLPEFRQVLNEFTASRARAIRGCQSIASNPGACLEPYDWKP